MVYPGTVPITDFLLDHCYLGASPKRPKVAFSLDFLELMAALQTNMPGATPHGMMKTHGVLSNARANLLDPPGTALISSLQSRPHLIEGITKSSSKPSPHTEQSSNTTNNNLTSLSDATIIADTLFASFANIRCEFGDHVPIKS